MSDQNIIPIPRERAVRFLPLSEPMFLILMALAHADLHGYGILQAIKTHSGEQKSLRTGTLYNALSRLQRQALISDAQTEPVTATSTGAPSESRGRTYTITELGSAVFEAESQRLAGLLEMASTLAEGSN